MLNTDDTKTIRDTKILLQNFYNDNVECFNRLFLDEKSVLSKYHNLEVLVDLGIVERYGIEYSSNYMIYPIENIFIITDFPSVREYDRVFPIFDDESALLTQRLYVNEGEIGLDIGTGSGVYAICGAKRGAKKIVATDINPKVKKYFDFNAILNGVEDKVEFILGDINGEIKNEKFDFLVSNPPFVPTPPEAHFYIHSNGGILGLDVIRAIFERKHEYLEEDGRIQMVALSLGQKETPLIFKELSRYFLKEKVEIVLTKLYGSPLGDLSLFINCFKGVKSFSEWKEILMIEGCTNLHYFYIEINPADKFSINLRCNEKLLKQTYYSGSWEGRLRRYSLPNDTFDDINIVGALFNEKKQMPEIFVS